MTRKFRPFAHLLLAVLAATAVAMLSGCEDDDDNVVVPEPAISVTVSASSDTLRGGGTVTLIASATTSEAAGDLTYSWSSTAGSFSSTSDDTTTWTGPETAGMYDVSCIVTDGKNAGIGTKMLGVDTYMPADSPFYRGATYCQGCHDGGSGGDQHTTWAMTGHAHAWETLNAIGQGRNNVCLPCHTVGSVGTNADPDLNNGGYDETAVARLQGVQCENCHGPGSAHPGDFASVDVVLEADLCGACHNGAHHPTFDEWSGSPHAGVIESAALRGSCSKCHNGLVAVNYLDAPQGFPNPPDPTAALPFTCAVCHDPHGNENNAYLRNAAATDVVLPDGTVVPEAGAGRLCMSCHNGRRAPTDIAGQIASGSDHFGPHHSVQGDMLAGTGAYEDVQPGFPWTSSRHLAVRDGCVHCHTHGHEGEEVYTGHGFLPTVEACEECHGPITDFTEIMAKQDYDGNGQIEGVQLEITGLLGILKQAIVDASLTPGAADSLANAEDFAAAVGDTLITTVEQREAGYNYFFVDFDGSHGVHNTTYAIQLLQQSTLAIAPGKLPPGAYILRE
jgi:hypothetical protein